MPIATMLVLLLVITIGAVRIAHHPPPPPAVIERGADAHMFISSQLDARMERLLHDRPPVVRSAHPQLIALTFDDGPYALETPLLLDVLRDLNVKATFFLIGDDARLYPKLTERIEREGHEIANHTLTHPAHFEALSPNAVRAELLENTQVLERYAGDPAIRTMMRPPHGRYTEQTVRAAQQAGFNVILWNEDPGDWRTTISADHIANDIELHATAPDIVLLHSGRMETIEMLPELVARFRRAGYRFVTVGELLRRLPVDEINHPLRHSV